MKYDIELLKRKMLVKYPFFGSVVAGVEYIEDNEIPTAETDGEKIYYNPNFLNNLSKEEQTFVFAHEVCHIAFNHILRSEGKDEDIWNIATDAVINQFLKKDGLPLAKGGVDIEEAINYNAEDLYKLLLKKQNKNEQSNNQNSGNSNNHQKNNSNQKNNEHKNSNESSSNEQQETESNQTGNNSNHENEEKNNVSHNTHNLWKDAVKKHKKQQEKSNQNNNQNHQKDNNQIEKKQKELENLGEKNAFKKNRDVKKKQLEELKEAISKQASKAGNSTNSDIRTVNDIGYAKPLIDWRYILKEAIKYDVDWSYQNATIENGVVSANLEEQPFPETEIVLDTSGSINEVLLRNFLGECKNILKHSKLKVGCFDTKFYGFTEIRTEEDLENMKFLGGGGTNFDAAVNAFSRRVENKIVFTDGEASMPKMTLDAVWIVFGNKKINPKGGKVINITQEQLDRLYSFEINNAYNRKTR